MLLQFNLHKEIHNARKHKIAQATVVTNMHCSANSFMQMA